MEAANITVDPVHEGDTWGGIPEITVQVGGAIYSSPVVSVVMEFRNSKGVVLDTCSTANGRAVIVDGDAWSVKVLPQELKLKKGRCDFGVKFYTGDNKVWTLLKGKLKVLERRVS